MLNLYLLQDNLEGKSIFLSWVFLCVKFAIFSCFNVTVKEEDVTMDIDTEMINPEDLITNEYDLLRNLDPAAADEWVYIFS